MTIYCPECGMDYETEADLDEKVVYVCDHCKTECVAGGINGLMEYWGEFWADGKDTAPRVTIDRKRTGYYSDSLRAMFTESMEAVAGLSVKRSAQ